MHVQQLFLKVVVAVVIRNYLKIISDVIIRFEHQYIKARVLGVLLF